MSRRNRKKGNDTPIELVIPVILAGWNVSQNQNLKQSAIIFFVSLIVICTISFSIRYLIYKKRKDILLNSGMDIVDKMTGEEFEKFLLVHFAKLGYAGELTPATNDYGADLILKKKKSKIVVQAKRWSSKVGIEAVQQIVGAKQYYNANECIVATNNFFTPNAKNLALSSGVDLWDRSKLIEVMNISNGREMAQEVTINSDIANRVICPKCGSEMIFKKGKYGDFYGCSKYPKCRYTKNLN